MKKLVAVALGSVAVASMTLISAGYASGDGPLDVSGEPYAKAIALLRSQGYQGVFGGSVGSDVPQAACMVTGTKVLPSRRISLFLNCTRAAQPPPDPNGPVVGSNGITTVKATPVPPPATPAVPPPGG